jgi:signal transduction histidine kinase
VRALRLALDTELAASVRTLVALSASTALAERRNQAFADRLRHLLAAEPTWSTAGVIGADGSAMVVENRPGFASDGRLDPVTLARVLAERRPVISGLVAKPDGVWLNFIAVPVLREGRAEAALYVGIEHSAWLGFLGRYPIPSSGALTLIDRDDVIVARTLNDPIWVGKAASADFVARSRGRIEGAFINVGLEGQAFYSAFSRSELSGWTLGTGVPQREVEEALLGSSLLTLGGFVVAGVLAVLLAILFGRRMARSVTSLANVARMLPDSRVVPAPDAPAVGELDEVRHALVTSRNLLHQREAALNEAVRREGEARAEAEHANVAKDRFLAMLGHELRNPLNVIANAAAVLDRQPLPEETAQRSRDMIRRQVRHLVRMVDDLLDVARLTSGRIVLTPRELDLAEVVRHSIEALDQAGRLAHVALDVALAPAHVVGDETRLEQVVTNLIDNAGKYTPAGGWVRVRVGVSGGQAVLEVADSGLGLAPELLPRVFDLFIQGERTLDRAQGGLGLGLAVVRRLVELHGGSVEAASDGPGRGARFVVRLLALGPQ